MRRSLPFYLLFIIISTTLSAQQWSQWRGDNRDGFVKNATLPDNWPEGLTPKWAVEIGKSYASPVADEQFIYTFSRKDDKETVTCLRREDGEIVWQQQYDAPFKTNQYALKFEKGPFSTPTLHNGRLYTLGIGSIFSCFDAASGKLLWQHPFSDKTPDTAHFFVGIAMSPIIVDGLCIVHIGEETGGRMIAVDAVTGEEKWQWDGDKPGYASPIAITLHGELLLITQTQNNVVGIAAKTGRLLWQIPYASAWKENIITPVAGADGVIYISGVKRGMSAYRLHQNNGEWRAEKAWHTEEVSLYMNTPVLLAGHLYGFSHLNKGQYFCLNAATGKLRWLSEGRQGQNASIVSANGRLLSITTDAALLVISPDVETFQVLQRTTLGESAVWGHPLFFKDAMAVQDETHIRLFTW